MEQKTLRERLINYFRKNHTEWIPSGYLQRFVMEHTSYTPSNVSRRLRELENDGLLQVEYRKGHAFYKFREQQLALTV